MKRSYFFLSLLLAIALVGCEDPTKGTGNNGSNSGNTNISDSTYTNSDDFIENWDAYANNEMKVIALTWSASSVDINGTYDGVTITADGTDVTVVSTAKKVQYVLSGTCSDGSFKVYSDKKFVLQLNGITLNNPSGPAINIQKGKTAEDDGGYPHKAVYVLVTDGTTNTLTDGSSYSQSVTIDGVDEDQKACFFSEGQLLFSGAGTLNVTGNNRHAVRSDDYIRLRNSVKMNITANGEDGINGKDYLIVDGGTHTINVSASKGKGLKSDTILIAGGTTNITCTGSSAEGIEADYLTINDGVIECLAKDDGINAGKSLIINGGYVYTRGTNNDGLDSNGTITINGGVIVAVGSQVPEEGIDCDQNTFTITGGIVLGIGGASSTPTSGTCTQPSLLYGASCSANTRISLLDSDGNIVLSYVPEVALNQMTLLLSSPDLETGATYTLVSGGTYMASTASDIVSFHNLSNAGTLSSPTTLTTATLSSVVTTVGNVSNGGGPGGGGNPGGNPGGGPGGGGRPGGR